MSAPGLGRRGFLFAAGAAATAGVSGPAPTAPAVAVFDVRERGAVGDGAADDTRAIQATIDATPSSAGVVLFPPGVYRITEPLNVIDSAGPGHRRGLRILGSAGGASGAALGCQMVWDGPDDEPMWRLWSRDCVLSHLALRVRPGRRCLAAIDVDQAPDRQTACTNNTFEHLFITKAGGAMRYGVRIGARALANVEMMGFDTCYFEDIDEACVFIASRTGQSKAHRFYKCGFARARFGIFHETGSFVTFGCGFGYHSEAAVRLGSITDYIAINESDSEGCARFLKTGGGSRASWAVKINGARLALNGLAADGRFIDFTDGGPLMLENVLFGDVPNARFRIRAHAVEAGSMLLALGNVFPNDGPFDLTGRCRLIAFGNRGFDGSGRPVPLDDEVSASGDAEGRMILSTVGSISATRTKARNLRGSVRFAETAASATVRFERPEPDARYFVSAVVSEITGRPAPGARRVAVTGKRAAGFTVILEDAPGPGNAVEVDWILVR